MILVSNGRFCHRESVGQLIYMTKYMDKIFQLDSPDEMSPYVYLNQTIPSDVHKCYSDVRDMHKNTRQILISEYISDVMNEVFYGGSILTYQENYTDRISLLLNKKNLPTLKKEIFYRLARNLDSDSYESVKLATQVLCQQTGIYKNETEKDSRIYDLRNITAVMTLADVRKLSRIQIIIRQFAKISKKNKSFRRTGCLENGSIKYKKSVFVFLEDFEKHMDVDILCMIKTKKNDNLKKYTDIQNEINAILTECEI
jgi:hypothetical protein